MALDLPTLIKEALTAEEIDDVLVVLVTIADSSLSSPILYTNYPGLLATDPLTYGIVSNGLTYNYALQNVVIPTESEDLSQSTDIIIDNIVENVEPLVRNLTLLATVTIALALRSQPDTQFLSIPNLVIVDRNYEMATVTLSVSRYGNRTYSADRLEPLVGERQTRNKAPGLHR